MSTESSTIMEILNSLIRHVACTIKDKYKDTPGYAYPADSPLKYVDWVLEDTMAKSMEIADFIDPPFGYEIYEIGPGTGYLLAYLKFLYGCNVCGCDVPCDLYSEARLHLQVPVDMVPPHLAISPHYLMADSCYDYIIATQVSWMDNWCTSQYLEFVQYCFDHLNPGGKLVLSLNPKAVRGERSARLHRTRKELPHITIDIL